LGFRLLRKNKEEEKNPQDSLTFDRVIRAVKKVRQVQRLFMGADAPVPLVMMNAAAVQEF
jgi:hypothetical protein